jgi:DNA modification methylase
MCGDATVITDVERLMGGKKADMVFTDPPYNVNYGDKASMLNDYQKGHRNTSSIKNDNMKKDDFLRFLIDSFKSIYVALCPGGAFYICHAESTGLEFRKAVLEAGFLLKQCIIWAKNSLVIGRQDYQWKHEPILYGWKPGAAHRWYGGRKNTTVIEDNAQVVIEKQDDHAIIHLSLGLQQLAIKVSDYEVIFDGDDNLTTVWRIEKPQRNDVHPTMKPVGLCARAIGNSSKPGEIVLDVFGGSGSTLIAAEQLNRTSYMMELDPIYCDVIIKRWDNFTGQKAVLLDK